MQGIDMNKPIAYHYSSLRYFMENEHHVTRICNEEVLVMVFEGVLRFTEDGIRYEVHPGEYHIQKKNSRQSGDIVSDSPKYLFVHFLGEWSEGAECLPFRGEFDYPALKPMMEELDKLCHSRYTITEQAAKFYEILSLLYRRKEKTTLAGEIADFISGEYMNGVSLERIAKQFHFSKNHIINVFKKEYKMTPFEYMNDLKIKKAERLLEVTSDTAERIAFECGFNDYAYFYKVFCRKNNISPQEWRRQKWIRPTGNATLQQGTWN